MTDISNFFFYLFSISVVYFVILGFGSLVKNFFYKDFFFKFLAGYFFIGLISLFANFFTPISSQISILVTFLGIVIFFINYRDFNKKELLALFFIYIASSIILILYSDHPIDSNMYHHPFVSYLNAEKIIFGVANIQFRFGHISFLQYVQAILISDYFHILNISAPNIILFISFIYFCGKKIISYKEVNFISLLILILSSFLLIKYGRYREFGNDIIPLLVSFYALIRVIEVIFLNKEKNLMLFNLAPLYGIFIFTHKISYIFSVLIFLVLINLKNLNLKAINFRIIIVFFIFTSLWLTKNYINSTCLTYPMAFTCFENTNWSLGYISKVESASYLTELWSKGFISNPDWQKINLSEYIQNFNWVENWLRSHFIKILEKLSPIFSALLIIFGLGFIYKQKKIETFNFRKLYFIIFFIFIGLIIWFIKAPLFRYGAFYVVSFISLIFLVIYSYLFGFNNKFKKKYLSYLFLFSLVFFALKNIDRIIESKKSFLPETVFKFNDSDVKFKFLGNKKIKILKPDGHLCYYSYYLCSHEVHRDIKVIKYGNYFITRH
jgi:hypothetical protein